MADKRKLRIEVVFKIREEGDPYGMSPILATSEVSRSLGPGQDPYDALSVAFLAALGESRVARPVPAMEVPPPPPLTLDEKAAKLRELGITVDRVEGDRIVLASDIVRD